MSYNLYEFIILYRGGGDIKFGGFRAPYFHGSKISTLMGLDMKFVAIL